MLVPRFDLDDTFLDGSFDLVDVPGAWSMGKVSIKRVIIISIIRSVVPLWCSGGSADLTPAVDSETLVCFGSPTFWFPNDPLS